MTNTGAITGPARVEFKRIFPASPEELWAYFVEDEKRKKWFCGGNLEPHTGGTIVFDFDHRRLSDNPPPAKYAEQNMVRLVGEIVLWEPPERLAFSWPEADGKTSTRVTILLRPANTGTQLHLVHEHLELEEHRLGAAAGWHTHLDLLDDILAGRPARDFWLRHAEVEAIYQPGT
jgi:uncharacterized protein YndB with AHSA1/START domain